MTRREKKAFLCEKRREAAAAKEAERIARFEARCAALRAQGYEQTDRTLKILSANIWGFLVALPFAAAAIALYVLFADKKFLLTGNIAGELALLFLCMAASVPAHEGLHALFWAAVNRSFAGIRFGFIPAALTPYCTCEREMGRVGYLSGCLAPFALLGVGLCLGGILSGYLFFLIGGVFNILAAGGDLLVSLRTFACGRGCVFLDHPTACGFFSFRRKSPAEKMP